MPKGQKEEANFLNLGAEKKFSQESLNWIYEEKLENDVNFQKLIKLYDRIVNLEENDPRKAKLVEMWESEINKLFEKEMSKKTVSKNSKKEESPNRNKSNIDGWKERLNIKQRSSSPDSLREQLMKKLNSSDLLSGRDTREDILIRAGLPENPKEVKLDYVAKGKNPIETGINDIDNILDDIDQTSEIAIPDSILKNDIIEARDYSSAIGFTVDLDENNIAGGDSSFNFDGETVDYDDLEFQQRTVDLNKNNDVTQNFDASKTLTNELDLTNAIDINYETMEMPDTGGSIFNKILDPELKELQEKQKEVDLERRDEEYSKINPDKRNIIDKADFSFFDREDVMNKYGISVGEKEDNVSKPFHEIRPIGSYGMIYDVSKQPSMQNLINEYKKENEVVDEMNDKIEFLRDLQNERKHRVNLMHVERNNSFIVARSNRLREKREARRLKEQEVINLKALERQERLRRLQERQKLIQLMKERQMKRSEEKRVSSILQMERERRLAKNNKYREEIAAIDAQIRFEQESIKNAELKLKTYFTKNSDAKLFDDSMKIAREFSKFAVSEEKISALQKFEDEKRQKRIERLSKKFVKNKK
ncbi:hypothetical protein [Spiroplasma alleghenense]|uniref:Uncharacterized protein n=1 Tax=Spiroplasma alleghenense TaxID=216931 RepID=A0A345Z3A8_9MOLU|nr:hypothetical protein [Spiroplasma alleghenense]AXK51087.1 hypothetical protein SALLE_v1c04130 [Spiroplasma alleghenense]